MDESMFKINYRSYRTFCHVCLSEDRQLFSIEKYADLIRRICEKIKLPLSPLLCWECTAILRKIKEFKEKAEFSTKVLNKLVNGQKLTYHSLSNLKITGNKSIETIENVEYKDIIDNIKHEIVVNNTNDNYKLNVNCTSGENKGIDVKQEINENHNIYNDDDESFEQDTYLHNKIKREDKSNDINYDANKKRPINKQYRIINNDIKDFKSLVRTIPLNTEQVKLYLVKERLNDLYTELAYKCEWCVSSWKTKNRWIQHNRKYHDKSAGRHQCDICLSRFVRKKDLVLHIRRHFTLFECRFCSYRSYRNLMKRHLKTHDKKVECVKCEAKFSNIYLFYQHHKELHVIFICDVCGKKTRSKKILEKHMSRHYEKYECTLCNRIYKTRASYKRHREEKHSPATDEAYCVQCDKKFKNDLLYKRHIVSSSAHAAERDGDRSPKKVPCPDCGRVYSRRVYMMNHYTHVHMKQSKYYCEQCNKHFLNRTRYVDHVRYNHEGIKKEKNKLCNICGRGFAANRTLINHIRTHSGERPFECEYCGAKFTQKHAMLSHVNYIHLKNKRRNCWQ